MRIYCYKNNKRNKRIYDTYIMSIVIFTYNEHSDIYDMKCDNWEDEKDAKQSPQPAKQVLVEKV